MNEIPIQTVRENWTYNHETGILTWKIKPAQHVNIGDIAGCLDKSTGYLRTQFRGKDYKNHRIIWAHFHGHWPKHEIDHISGDKADNRIENLRDVTSRENQQNQRLYKNNKTGVVGVHWNKVTKKWRVTIKVNGKLKYLGSFIKTDFQDAVTARQAANVKYGYHVNHGKRAA